MNQDHAADHVAADHITANQLADTVPCDTCAPAERAPRMLPREVTSFLNAGTSDLPTTSTLLESGAASEPADTRQLPSRVERATSQSTPFTFPRTDTAAATGLTWLPTGVLQPPAPLSGLLWKPANDVLPAPRNGAWWEPIQDPGDGNGNRDRENGCDEQDGVNFDDVTIRADGEAELPFADVYRISRFGQVIELNTRSKSKTLGPTYYACRVGAHTVALGAVRIEAVVNAQDCCEIVAVERFIRYADAATDPQGRLWRKDHGDEALNFPLKTPKKWVVHDTPGLGGETDAWFPDQQFEATWVLWIVMKPMVGFEDKWCPPPFGVYYDISFTVDGEKQVKPGTVSFNSWSATTGTYPPDRNRGVTYDPRTDRYSDE